MDMTKTSISIHGGLHGYIHRDLHGYPYPRQPDIFVVVWILINNTRKLLCLVPTDDVAIPFLLDLYLH